MVFILADTATSSIEKEDTENMIRAIAVMTCKADLPFRLMLISPNSCQKAAQLGLPRRSCYCISTLKINMLSQACRVPGFAQLVTGMVTSSIVPYAMEAEPTAENLGADVPNWTTQFLYGSSQVTERIRICETYHGMT